MDSILTKILATKQQELQTAGDAVSLDQLKDQVPNAPPPRDFLQAIRGDSDISLIAEVKKASPSKGLIREDFRPVEIAAAYCRGGASCISVLTDKQFFQGSLEYLTAVRAAVEIPVLRKDFIIAPYQVYQARVAGADAVLLIAECLAADQLVLLHDLIVALGMTPLVELHNENNLQKVLDCGAQLVGINNRNLETFETDLQHCLKIRERIGTDVSVVGESGIFTSRDVQQLRDHGINAMLVGESLMRAEDIEQAVRQLLAQP